MAPDCTVQALGLGVTKESFLFKVTGGYPSQRVNNAEIVSIWWRHHELIHVSLFSGLFHCY